MRSNYPFILCLLYCLLINTSHADTLSVALSPSYYAFSLTEQGRLAVAEQGHLQGAALALNWQIASRVAMTIASERARGVADYEGFAQLGNHHTSRTDYTLNNWGASLLWFLNDRFALVGGLHKTQWDRNIRATPVVLDLDEQYQWQAFSIGFRMEWPFSKGRTLQLNATTMQMMDAHMKFDYPGYADNPIVLDGQNGNGTELGVTYQKCSGAQCWSIGARHCQLNFSDSDLQVIQLPAAALSVFEPATRWSLTSITAGWHYSFTF